MEEKPDWLINSLQGKLKGTTSDLAAQGIDAEDFSIDPTPDDYWNMDVIKQAFTDDSGKERRDLFENYYKTAKDNYVKARKAEFDINNLSARPYNVTAARLNSPSPITITSKSNPDPWGRSYGLDYSQGDGFSEKRRGWRETGIKQGVKLADGEYVNPKEFDGLAKFAKNDDGSFKLNENGSPYLVPVRKGEELKTYDEVYNNLSETLGYYGHDYDATQILSSVLIKNPLNFVTQTLDALAEYPKALMALTGTDDSELYNSIVSAEQQLKGLNIPNTERGQDFFSLESLTDLSQQVVYQLGAMVLSGGSISALTGSAKLGQIGARLFMVGMSAGHISEVARDNGLSNKESAALLGMMSAAYYPLMGLSENVISKMGLANTNAALKDVVEEAGIQISKTGLKGSSAKSLFYNVSNRIKDTLYKLDKSAPMLAGAANEAAEEVSEQLVDGGIRRLYDLYNTTIDEGSSVAKWMGTKKGTEFGWDWNTELKALGQSAIGGAVGGSVATKLFGSMGKHNAEAQKNIHDMVMDGKEKVLYQYIDNMYKQGRMGEPFLDSENNLTNNPEESLNEINKNAATGMVDYLVKVRDSKALDKLYEKNEQKAGAFAEILRNSSIGKDAANLNREIMNLQNRVQEMTEEGASQEDIEEVNELISMKAERLKDIKNGKFVDDYVAEALYNVYALSKENPDVSLSRLSGRSFMNLSKQLDYNFQKANEQYGSIMENIQNRNKVATLEDFEGVSEDGKNMLVEQANKDYDAAYKGLEALKEPVNKIINNFEVDWIKDDPEEQIAILKSNLDNLDGESKEAAENLVKSYEALSTVSAYNPVPLPVKPNVADSMLDMVSSVDMGDSGRIYQSSPVSIQKALADERALKKDMNKEGVSLYNNTDQLLRIKNSVDARIAQVSALPFVNEKLSGEQFVSDLVKDVDTDNLLETLKGYSEEVNSLIEESLANENSAEEQIKKATLKILSDKVDELNEFANVTAGTDFDPIIDIVNSRNPELMDAIEKGDINKFLSVQREVESQLYNDYSQEKDNILKLFDVEGLTATQAYSGEYDSKINAYNYARGILSLDANVFWNAYVATVNNSNTANKVASQEQELIVKHAVSSLFAGSYDAEFYNSPQATNHHYSVFVEGEGGTGKTSQVIPLIAGIMQKIQPSKVLLTAYKDSRDNKRSNLVNQVYEYYRTSDKTYAIDINQTTDDILYTLTENREALKDTGLIVYDEATLLTTEQLEEIQNALREINRDRKPSQHLRMVYTGDTNQNCIDYDRANTDRQTGINVITRHVIDRTTPLSFSFRQMNAPLKHATSYFKAIQNETGQSKPIQFEYSNGEGVRVIHERDKFESSVLSKIETLKKNGKIEDAVYITDKPKTELNPKITSSGIAVLTSEEAQGEEWENVFYDPKDKELFKADKINRVGKKAAYTAVTRAHNYVVMSFPENQNISSKRATITNVSPLSGEKFNRVEKLNQLQVVLGDGTTDLSKVKPEYNSSPVTVITKPDELFTEDEMRTREEQTVTEEELPETKNIFSELIAEINEKSTFRVNTFFTDSTVPLPVELENKRKLLYDKKTINKSSYFLTIAKIGSEGYNNVINNNPKFKGEYAVFLEGELPDGQTSVLGILPAYKSSDTDVNINDLIRKSGIMEGIDGQRRIKIDSSFLATSDSKAPHLMKKPDVIKTFGKLKQDSNEGLTYGRLKILTRPVDKKDNSGKIGATENQVFIPVSFSLSAAEMEQALEDDFNHSEITRINLRPKKLSAQQIIEQIENRITKDGKVSVKSEDGVIYRALWGNLGETRETRENNKRNLIGLTFDEILKTINPAIDGAYYDFVKGYDSSNNRAMWFMKNYIETKAKGKPTTMFERALKDLTRQPQFKDGFAFDPAVSIGSTKSAIYANAKVLPEDMIEDYFFTEGVESLTLPQMRVQRNDLINVINQAQIDTTQKEVVNSETEEGTSTRATVTPMEGEAKEDFEDSIQKDNNTILDFQRKYYNGAAIEFMEEGIDIFKRGLYNHIFKLKEIPGIMPLNDAVELYKYSLEQKVKDFNPPTNFEFDVNDHDQRQLYHNFVIKNELENFLLPKFFPMIKQGEDGYSYVSTSNKQKGFYDKESFSLLFEGMNEMVITHLFNTPIITKDSKSRTVYKRNDNGHQQYLSRGDIEEVTNLLNGARSLEQIEDILSGANSDVAKSVYHRMFSKTPIRIEGENVFSLNSIDSADVRSMVNGIGVFFASGQVFNLAFVTANESKYNLPLSVFGAPNIIREQTMEGLTAAINDLDIKKKGSVVTLNGKKYPSNLNNKKYSNEEVVDALRTIGIGYFTEQHLQDIQKNDLNKLGISNSPGSAQKVNDTLMKNVFFKSLSGAKFNADLNIITESVARIGGIENTLDYINLNGDRVYRLRNTSPIFSISNRISESVFEGSPLTSNMLVNGNYKIDRFFVKDGFKTKQKARVSTKSNSKLLEDEVIEMDVLWGFANTLAKSNSESSTFSKAAIPIMVFADSSTEVVPIVKTDNFFKDTKEIASSVYEANKVYYEKLSSKILSRWNNMLGTKYRTLNSLKNYVNKNEIPISQVENTEGMIKNLTYVKVGNYAKINPLLIEEAKRYNGTTKSVKSFNEALADNSNALLERVKEIRTSKGSLYDILGKAIKGKSADDIVKAYYYNWFAVSNQAHQLLTGPLSQYKGSTQSEQYVDMVKRAKSEVSNHSAQLFRNSSWREDVDQQGLTFELREEGKKLPRFVNVAYVKDIEKSLFSLAGATINQEIYDGATFVTPLTRIYQRYSNGGAHGTNTPPVMKNITTSFDPELGVKTFIKNAEFEITPEIMRQGSERVVNLVRNMLNKPFPEPVMMQRGEEAVEINSAWDYLTKGLGVKEDLSNILPKDERGLSPEFEKLADFLVENNYQDVPLTEVIPASSAKTGMGAVNDFDAGEYTSSQIDLYNKGTQLDASHDPFEGLETSTPSQMVNAISMGYKTPENIEAVYNAISTIALDEVDSWNIDSKDVRDRIKSIIRTAMENKENISYVHELIQNDFPFDNPQVINIFISNLAKRMGDDAISFKFAGGHYVVHPSDGLIQLYDVTRDGVEVSVLKDELEQGEEAVARDLRWADPISPDGKPLSEIVSEIHEKITGIQDPINNQEAVQKAYKENPKMKIALRNAMVNLNKAVQEGDWIEGEAEILLPMDMRGEFSIKGNEDSLREAVLSDLVDDIDYFRNVVASRLNENSQMTGDEIEVRAQRLMDDFNKRIEGLMIRIPTTAKHSGVATRVAGFMNESLNSVFVPSMFLYVQGADQDIDKGSYMTYETINGYIPMVDENNELVDSEYFSNKKEARKIALKNKITYNMRQTLSSAKNFFETNVSVETVLDKLRDMRDKKLKSFNFSTDNYLSQVEIFRVNQSGKALVGIFANAQKVYQVLYSMYKSKGINDDNTLFGLNTELEDARESQVWMKIAGLINAATDNAKEQILGILGISEDNANMVSYLITRGKSFDEIIDFFDRNKEPLQKLAASKRYDNFGVFRPSKVWKGNDELIRTYRNGEEFSTIASSILNRKLPSSASEIYSHKKRIENFVNKSYARVPALEKVKFDFIQFLSDEGYANRHVELYQKMIVTDESGNITGNHTYNILELLRDSTHVNAYSKVYLSLYNTISNNSKVFNLTNSLLDETYPNRSVQDYQYRQAQDYVYGIAVHNFFQGVTMGSEDLGTIEGRESFVTRIAKSVKNGKIKAKFPNNPFIQSSIVVNEDFSTYKPAPVAKTFDLMNVKEEKLLELRAGFEALPIGTRKSLVYYSLIVNRGRMGKGSFAQLFSVSDMKPFNDFLIRFLDDNVELDKDTFTNFLTNKLFPNAIHNSIPYEEYMEPREFGVTEGDIKLGSENVDFINNFTNANIPRTASFNETLSIEYGDGEIFRGTVLDFITNEAKDFNNAPQVAAYFDLLKQQYESKKNSSISEGDVQNREDNC